MRAEPFDRGIVTISLDTELGWARVNTGEFENVADRLDEGRTGIRRLLEAFDEYDIPATWAIVGQLLDPAEPTEELEELPTIASDIPWERDWWRMPSLLEEIRDSEPGHEIASHSGSHLLYDEIEREVALKDVDYVADVVGRETGEPITSFVFPQNRPGHTNVLTERGIVAYRGVPEGSSAPTPTMSVPTTESNMVNVPLCAGFRHFDDRHPLLACAPTGLKVWGLKLGVRRAARNNELFHVGLHPKDFALEDGAELLAGFRSWLSFVDDLRSRGTITVHTMGDVASRVMR